MPTWDPERYLGFAGERERPFADLLARVPLAAPARVVDLGCGPGTATAELLVRWPGACVVGVDSAEEMLERARGLEDAPRLTFVLGDIATWQPEGPLDLIVSSAALHWVPGHLDLLGRWAASLSAGGVIALQVPGNLGAPSHRLLAQLAAGSRWRERLAGTLEVTELHDPREYLVRLAELGARVDAWETTYHHVLQGSDPVLEWMRGSALRPVLDALDGAEAQAFTAQYARGLRLAYPPERSGETIFPFRRVFAVAQWT